AQHQGPVERGVQGRAHLLVELAEPGPVRGRLQRLDAHPEVEQGVPLTWSGEPAVPPRLPRRAAERHGTGGTQDPQGAFALWCAVVPTEDEQTRPRDPARGEIPTHGGGGQTALQRERDLCL